MEDPEGAYAPPKIVLRWGKAHLTFRNGNISRKLYISQKMADHFLKTPGYEQFKYPGLVVLFSISLSYWFYEIDEFEKKVLPVGWSCYFHACPLTKIPGSAPAGGGGPRSTKLRSISSCAFSKRQLRKIRSILDGSSSGSSINWLLVNCWLFLPQHCDVRWMTVYWLLK